MSAAKSNRFARKTSVGFRIDITAAAQIFRISRARFFGTEAEG